MKSFRRSQGHGNGHSHSNSHGQAGPSSGFRPPGPNGPNAPNAPNGPNSPALPFANPLSRPTERVAPPQKVIKALASHRSTNPQQLSYSKGDFWYVIGERDEWYEALNPITSSRGLVPKKDFEEFAKGGRQHQIGQPTSPTSPTTASIPDHTRSLSNSHVLPTSNPMHSPTAMMMGPTSAPTTPGNKRVSPLYAIVQYDFHAERPDELQAKAGEPIVVIAQSNHEWFVAKPIGRLGGPGLIPVTFVEIRDPVTGLRLDSFPTNIPQVEEWKKATAEYKAAAIPLGRLDLPPDQRVTNSPFQAQANSQGGGSAVPSNRASQRTQASQRTRSSAGSATGLGASAAGGMTRHQPQEAPPTEPHPSAQAADAEPMLPPGELTELGVPSFHNESGNYWFRLHAVHVPDEESAPASKLILYRTYEDFYDFQIALLDTFPAEAGRPEHEGEAPPPRILPYMPGPVDEAIDDELTEYRRDELDAYVRALLDLRGADAGYILRHELIRSFFAAKFGDYSEEITREQGMENLQNLAHRMSAMNLARQAHHANNRSVDQAAMPSPFAPPPQSPIAQYNGHAYAAHGHTRTASRDIASSQGHGRQMSGQQVHAPHAGQWANSPSAATGASFANQHAVPTPPMPSAPAPPPANPRSGAAFVKVKVYDKATDDLIALRVHPQVTYAELLEKVRARLGPDVNVLSYKVGGSGGSAAAGAQGPTQAIRDDVDMAEWMAVEDQRLILYAEQ